MTRCPYRVELDKLEHIYVGPSDGADQAQRTIVGYFVRIEQGIFQYLTINIAKEQLVPIMAALTYYSPRAKLLEATNF